MIRFSENHSFSYFERSLNAHYSVAVAAGVAAAGIGTAVYQGVSGKHKMKRQLEYNRLLMKEQQEYARQNWQMENEYNLPINQVQRLKDAGINPALYFGNNGGSPGLAGSIDTPSAADVDSYQPDYSAAFNGIVQGLDMYFNSQIKSNQIKTTEEQAKITELERKYKEAYLNDVYPSVKQADIAESNLRAFNAATNLKIGSTDQIMFEDGYPSGYFDESDGKYHNFNQQERAFANTYLMGNLQYQQTVQTSPRSGEVLDLQIKQQMQSIQDVISQMESRKILTRAQANQLNNTAHYYKTQAEFLNYEIQQLRKTEDASGKNVSTRMKELQENLVDLQKDYQKWQLDMKRKYGEIEEVMNQIVIPIGSFVGQVAGAAMMLHPATRSVGMSSTFLGATVGRSTMAQPANPFVSYPNENTNNVFTYP